MFASPILQRRARHNMGGRAQMPPMTKDGMILFRRDYRNGFDSWKTREQLRKIEAYSRRRWRSSRSPRVYNYWLGVTTLAERLASRMS